MALSGNRLVLPPSLSRSTAFCSGSLRLWGLAPSDWRGNPPFCLRPSMALSPSGHPQCAVRRRSHAGAFVCRGPNGGITRWSTGRSPFCWRVEVRRVALAGHAAPTGFRISGAKIGRRSKRHSDNSSPPTRSRDGTQLVSNRCGSMLAIAQGVGVALLLFTLVLCRGVASISDGAGVDARMQILVLRRAMPSTRPPHSEETAALPGLRGREDRRHQEGSPGASLRRRLSSSCKPVLRDANVRRSGGNT